MKKLTLSALLLTAAMLVACDSGTTVVPGSSTQSSGTSTEAPATSRPVASSSIKTTAPVATTTPVTTVPVTYATLYQPPEVPGTHSDVVPVETINSFTFDKVLSPFYSSFSRRFDSANRPTFTEIKEYLDSLDLHGYATPDYEIALVTPLEFAPYGDNFYIRVAVDYVYDIRIKQEHLKFFKEEMIVYYKSKGRDDGWGYKEGEIPITTTGGKYIMLFYIDTLCIDGEGTDYRDVVAFPLTWELDMANVPGSTGDNWNRPPYIGNAEDYYAFGFGDVWERYMAK